MLKMRFACLASAASARSTTTPAAVPVPATQTCSSTVAIQRPSGDGKDFSPECSQSCACASAAQPAAGATVATRRSIAAVLITSLLTTPEAVCRMIVDDSNRLHPRIHDRRPDELETAPLQLFRNLPGGRGRPQPLHPAPHDRFAVGERPAEVRELFAAFVHVAVDARAADGGLDLEIGRASCRE